jgi:hypothetical protein
MRKAHKKMTRRGKRARGGDNNNNNNNNINNINNNNSNINNNNNGIEFVPFEERSAEELLTAFEQLPDQSSVQIHTFARREGILGIVPRVLIEDPRYYEQYREWLEDINPILEELMQRLGAISNQIENKVQEKWRQLVDRIDQHQQEQRQRQEQEQERMRQEERRQRYQPIVVPPQVRITNANFEVPNRINELAIKENAENAIMGELINMNRPVMILNDEEQYDHYYQNETSIRGLKESKRNPFTRKNITKITWYKPVPKNKNNN